MRSNEMNVQGTGGGEFTEEGSGLNTSLAFVPTTRYRDGGGLMIWSTEHDGKRLRLVFFLQQMLNVRREPSYVR